MNTTGWDGLRFAHSSLRCSRPVCVTFQVLMTMRSIFLCPDGLDKKIQAFREMFDPLGRLIGPHITVVFPFESSLPDETLVDHVATKIVSTPCFDASLSPQPVKDSEYVYFPIKEGAEQVSAMHNCLYGGILAQFLMDRPYTPHVTVGRAPPDKAQRILEEAAKLNIETKFQINTIKIERIGKHGESETITQRGLGSGS